MNNSKEKIKNTVVSAASKAKKKAEELKDGAERKIKDSSALEKAKERITLESIISAAIKIPGVRVDRSAFLKEQFSFLDAERFSKLVFNGPISVGIDRYTLYTKSKKLIGEAVGSSTRNSFALGLPGGAALLATIPGDMAQFYGTAIKLAQQIAYIYGEDNLWEGEKPDIEQIRKKLILYVGAMLEADGARALLRLITSPRTQSRYLSTGDDGLSTVTSAIIKSVTGRIAKEAIGEGVFKALPLMGGVVSGGITYFSMKPMGKRLLNDFDKAYFEYYDYEINYDIRQLSFLSKKQDTAKKENKDYGNTETQEN